VPSIGSTTHTRRRSIRSDSSAVSSDSQPGFGIERDQLLAQERVHHQVDLADGVARFLFPTLIVRPAPAERDAPRLGGNFGDFLKHRRQSFLQPAGSEH
jgi:hypothetical protein